MTRRLPRAKDRGHGWQKATVSALALLQCGVLVWWLLAISGNGTGWSGWPLACVLGQVALTTLVVVAWVFHVLVDSRRMLVPRRLAVLGAAIAILVTGTILLLAAGGRAGFTIAYLINNDTLVLEPASPPGDFLSVSVASGMLAAALFVFDYRRAGARTSALMTSRFARAAFVRRTPSGPPETSRCDP